MNVDAIIISDSSDEEVPQKKLKTEFSEQCNINSIRISKVTSLANTEKENNSEIVIIDDDDEVKNNVKIDPGSNLVKNNLQHETNSVDQNELITEVKSKYVKGNDKDICNDLSDTGHANAICEISNNNEPKFEKRNNETENISVTDFIDNKREISLEFHAFLDQCCSCECDRKYKDLIKKKIPNIKERYMQVNSEFLKNKQFLKLLNTSIERMRRKPADAIICFNHIWEELGAKKDRDDINLTDREAIHLKKLNKTLRLLNKKIKKLEEEPVNWEDDNNSSYIQLERYRKRFCDIHKKICSYMKENPDAGRPMYRKLDFDESKYPVINRAIEKLYNKTKSFPTYYDVDKCVKICVKDNNLNINGDSLDIEIRKVFTALGKLLQRRRKTELHGTLNDFLDDPKDPALENANLKSMLDKQYKDGEEKIEAILQKYTDKQEAGEEPSISSDSDDSNFESETSDCVE